MKPEKAAIIGGGVIGGGWAARLILSGVDVAFWDPDPEAERKMLAVQERACAAWQRMWPGQALGRGGRLYRCASIAEAVADAELVQESAPERLQIKQQLHQEIGASASAAAVIGSSTSGLLPSDIQQDMQNAGRMMVAHPYNPVYLLPVVELVGGKKTAPEALEDAARLYAAIGMHPVTITKEIDAFVGDRLLEAMWRESLWLIKDGVATAGQIDDIVRYGLGLRYAQMGQFLTYRLAGGEQGMTHFLEQFAPSLAWPWTKLTAVPELDEALIARITSQSDAQAEGRSIAELETIRDNNLVDILLVLKNNDWGAGQVLKNPAADTQPAADDVVSEDGVTWQGRVDADWTDYNNHMTEFRYLQVFSMATDQLLVAIGAGPAYVDSGYSYYTVETHIRHLDEVAAGQPLRVVTRLISHDAKRLHLFHEMIGGADDRLLATGEHMLLHVDMSAGKTAAVAQDMAARLEKIATRDAGKPIPEGVGAKIGRG